MARRTTERYPREGLKRGSHYDNNAQPKSQAHLRSYARRAAVCVTTPSARQANTGVRFVDPRPAENRRQG